MSMKKHLNFDALRQALSDLLYKAEDPRQASKVSYTFEPMGSEWIDFRCFKIFLGFSITSFFTWLDPPIQLQSYFLFEFTIP